MSDFSQFMDFCDFSLVFASFASQSSQRFHTSQCLLPEEPLTARL